MRLCGRDEQVFTFRVEAQNIHYDPVSFGQLFEQLTTGVIQIEVVVAVALTLPDKLLRIIREKENRVLRLYVPIVLFSKQIGFLFTGQGRITDQVHFVLVAVQLGNVDAFFVRAPSYVCQILLFRCSGLQPDCFSV